MISKGMLNMSNLKENKHKKNTKIIDVGNSLYYAIHIG